MISQAVVFSTKDTKTLAKKCFGVIIEKIT